MRYGELLIEGTAFGGPCDSSLPKDLLRSPWDNRAVGTVPEGDWTHLNWALEAMTQAHRERRLGSRDARRELLTRIAERIEASREELAQGLVEEIGKPITMARAEVDRCAVTFRLAAAHVPSDEWADADVSPDPRANGYRAVVRTVPVGPVLGFVPYNWSLNLAAHKLAPALAAGCPILLKVSPKGPLATLALAGIAHSCGAPPGTVNAWNGPDADAGRAVEDPRVAVFSFTGSIPVGWKLAARTKARHTVLELGGTAPCVVTATADLQDAAARVARSAYGYAGQVCISAQECWAHESVYAELKTLLEAETRTFPAGDPAAPSVLCGPVIDDAHADRLEALGAKREGRLVRPTCQARDPYPDEVFGPILTLHPYRSLEDLADRLHARPYGIHAALFTQEDPNPFAERLDYPGLVVNDAPSLRFDALPYGGRRRSGQGFEGVPDAIVRLREPRSLVTKHKEP